MSVGPGCGPASHPPWVLLIAGGGWIPTTTWRRICSITGASSVTERNSVFPPQCRQMSESPSRMRDVAKANNSLPRQQWRLRGKSIKQRISLARRKKNWNFQTPPSLFSLIMTFIFDIDSALAIASAREISPRW